MIERVKQLSIQTDEISAVLMYGSFIKGEGDQFSDIEFYIFLNNKQPLNKSEWISQISPVDLFFVNEFGTEVAIFNNMIRGEFHFHPVTEIHIIKSWEGFISFEYKEQMNLVDKDGKLSEVLNSILPPLRPQRNTVSNKESIAMNFLNNLLFEKNLLLRREFAHAHQLFVFIQKYILWMIRLHTGMDEHWESPTKSLENDISKEWYEKYMKCVPELNESSLNKSFRDVIEIADELFKELRIPNNIQIVLSKIKEM